MVNGTKIRDWTRRTLLVVPGMAFALFCTYAVKNWTRLPDAAASHFNAAGVADAWISRDSFASLAIGATALLVLAIYLAARTGQGRFVCSVLYFALAVDFSAMWLAFRANVESVSFASQRFGLGVICGIFLGVLAFWSAIGSSRSTGVLEASEPAFQHRFGAKALLFLPGVLVAVTVVFAQQQLWLRLVAAVGGLVGLVAIIAALVGFRYTIFPDRLEISCIGFCLRRLPASSIRAARLQKINALREFGGWGIRRGLNATAYIWRGSQAVVLESLSGEVFLGYEQPEELLEQVKQLLRTHGER